MEWYIILLIILASLLLLFIILGFIIGYFVTNMFIHPYCRPENEVIETEVKWNRFTLQEFNSYKFEDFEIVSRYGYKLRCSYLLSEVNSSKNNAIILVHGWTSNRYSMFAYAKMYVKLGFHVFIYDHRNHHQSDKNFTTMGHLEADDLESVVEYVKEKFNYDVTIGTHGESMGAATVMIHAGRYHSVSYVIEDCGYDSLKDLLAYQAKYIRHIPIFPAMMFTNFVFKKITGVYFNEVSPAKYLNTCDDIPMMFVHGDKDNFVPTYMVYKNYDSKNGYKKICLYKDCTHAQCITSNYKQYESDVIEFLKENKII